ncbi:MAG: 3-hydroxylacyl-ACP dehydratase [Burkholderiales bacterium]
MHRLTRSELAQLLPHDDAMCLLETVECWDEESILCRAISHRSRENPLRSNDELPAICAVEYAAQAMAVHGALNGGPRAGMLAALREVELFLHRLDDLNGDLVIHARKLIRDGDRLLYQFSVRCGDLSLVSGRAAVVLTAAS